MYEIFICPNSRFNHFISFHCYRLSLKTFHIRIVGSLISLYRRFIMRSFTFTIFYEMFLYQFLHPISHTVLRVKIWQCLLCAKYFVQAGPQATSGKWTGQKQSIPFCKSITNDSFQKKWQLQLLISNTPLRHSFSRQFRECQSPPIFFFCLISPAIIWPIFVY